MREDSTTPDTGALKALAHADRLRILGILRFDGPATATGLAKRLGLNSGATSYHLRQLAEYGFIAQDTALGNKRERWWRARDEVVGDDPAELSDEEMEAGLAMIRAVLAQQMDLMRQAVEEFPQQPPEWRRASNASDYTLMMTAEQAEAFKEKLTALLWEETRRSPPTGTPGPDGAREFMVMLHCFPVPKSGGNGDADKSG
ncbi:helix-turn-helix domain-containing protein [Magnetospira sp. QH-2]|uniref:winged helix-turn-helix domain-containing protein n=1 Tax=Magnetospira sp. (strain QH-2) TaxID=1288970 RepID=UPI0003E80C37|nr:helix-turn-helix domain-containing protein [Magnetospira sp. QH-2]CCQ74834.1 putative transcriptional regulator, ArsR family [Magnetospira sp. QH-2]